MRQGLHSNVFKLHVAKLQHATPLTKENKLKSVKYIYILILYNLLMSALISEK